MTNAQAMHRVTRQRVERVGLAQVERYDHTTSSDRRWFASCFAATYYNTKERKMVVLYVNNIGTGVLSAANWLKYKAGEQVQCWLNGHRYVINAY